MGMKGYPGDGGPQGPPGAPGPKGPSRGGGDFAQEKQSAFSVTLTTAESPPINTPLRFTDKIVNLNDDFVIEQRNVDQGKFVCKIPGLYYFVFHSQSMQANCLRLKRRGARDVEDTSLSFCDYNNRGLKQVVSGGQVMELSVGEKVWLEPFRGEKANADRPGQKFFIFNGFLISPTE